MWVWLDLAARASKQMWFSLPGQILNRLPHRFFLRIGTLPCRKAKGFTAINVVLSEAYLHTLFAQVQKTIQGFSMPIGTIRVRHQPEEPSRPR